MRDAVRNRLTESAFDSLPHTKDIGYELRCAKPVAFDVDYTRTLGFGAVRYLLDGGSGALIALSGGHVTPLDLGDLLDPETGRIRTRQVDLTTEAYRVARDYMVYLDPSDFSDDGSSPRSPRRRICGPKPSANSSSTQLAPREPVLRPRSLAVARCAVTGLRR